MGGCPRAGAPSALGWVPCLLTLEYLPTLEKLQVILSLSGLGKLLLSRPQRRAVYTAVGESIREVGAWLGCLPASLHGTRQRRLVISRAGGLGRCCSDGRHSWGVLVGRSCIASLDLLTRLFSRASKTLARTCQKEPLALYIL